MPIAAIRSQADRSGGGQQPIGLVTCPNCRVVMPRVAIKQSDKVMALSEALYRCPRCDTETRRWIALEST